MRKLIAIAKKECFIHFATPPAYIFWALTLAICSLWFWFANLHQVREASLRYVVNFMVITILFLTPIFTMRLFAEERKLKTLELLLTSPIREWQIVVGKYLGALAVLATFLLFTAIYPIILFWLGNPGPDPGMLGAQYLGLLLAGSACTALGLFFSSVTSSQVVAATLGFLSVLGLMILQTVASLTGSTVIGALTLSTHLDNFSRGIIDATDIYYFVALTGFLLFLTTRALEARRWARA